MLDAPLGLIITVSGRFQIMYVSSTKTLSFKAQAASKPNSKESKEVRETPTRKQSIKSMALKRGSGGDKENLCNGVQLSKLVTREFDRYSPQQLSSNSPIKDLPLSAVKKEGLFGFKINKNNRSKEDCSRSVVEPVSATVDLKAHMAGKSTKGSLDERSIKLKIHLKDDNKCSLDSKRKLSAAAMQQVEGPNCLNHPDKKVQPRIYSGEVRTSHGERTRLLLLEMCDSHGGQRSQGARNHFGEAVDHQPCGSAGKLP